MQFGAAIFTPTPGLRTRCIQSTWMAYKQHKSRSNSIPIFVSPSDDDLRARLSPKCSADVGRHSHEMAVDWHWTGKLCPYMYLPFEVASFAPVRCISVSVSRVTFPSFIKNKDPFVKLVFRDKHNEGHRCTPNFSLSSLRTSGSGIELVQRLFSTMVCH